MIPSRRVFQAPRERPITSLLFTKIAKLRENGDPDRCLSPYLSGRRCPRYNPTHPELKIETPTVIFMDRECLESRPHCVDLPPQRAIELLRPRPLACRFHGSRWGGCYSGAEREVLEKSKAGDQARGANSVLRCLPLPVVLSFLPRHRRSRMARGHATETGSTLRRFTRCGPTFRNAKSE